MFDTLKKLATGSRPATSTELRDALAGIGDAEFALAVDNAEAARSDALISGDEKIVEKTETALATARRDLDRARAAKEALAAKIVEAERREAADAIEAERSEIEALANAVAKDLAKIYPRASREISSVLERLVEAERRVASFNSRIANQDLSPIDLWNCARFHCIRIFPTNIRRFTASSTGPHCARFRARPDGGSRDPTMRGRGSCFGETRSGVSSPLPALDPSAARGPLPAHRPVVGPLKTDGDLVVRQSTKSNIAF